MPKELLIIVLPSGEVKMEVSGVVGGSCHDVTKRFLEELGKKKSEELKPEFFMKGETNNYEYT